MTRALDRRTLLAALAASGIAPRALAQPRPLVIPIASDFGHLMIKAHIDGREIWAGLDNGAETTMVDKAYSRSDRDELGRVRIPLNVSSGPPAPLTFVELGQGVNILAVGVGDLAGPSITDEVPIGAVIGMELFERYRVDIDFGARTVTVNPPAAALPPATRSVPLAPSSHKKHLVEIAVEGGAPFKAVLDLGCSRPILMHTSLAQRLGLTAGRLPSTNLAHGVNGNDRIDFTSRTGSLKSLAFAGRTFTDVPVEVGDLSYTGIEAEALLGVTLLRRFDIAFNRAANQFWVRDTTRLTDPFSRRYIGLQVEPTPAGLRVSHVAEASPALRAGFKTGEVLTAIDGAPPKPAMLREVQPGQVLRITLAGGTVRSVTAARFD